MAAVLGVCSAGAGDLPRTPVERSLGVRDVGVFSDLDAQVQLALPAALQPEQVVAVVDRTRRQLVLYDGTWPIKVYPLGGASRLRLGSIELDLRAGDRAELAPLLSARRLFEFALPIELPPGDADGDGIPDALDLRIGAHKVALNADRYDGRYQSIAYPRGDVDRTMGVCTDVVVRALRNAGYDLQQAVFEDIQRTRAAYPMIVRANRSIDHRRVKTLLPYFKRHFERHSPDPADTTDAWRPGDIVFMDTFPSRPGAEHIGIVADIRSASGVPLVINNWTDGSVTRAMELLSWVPVTDRFRLPARMPARGPIPHLKTQLLSVVSDSWSSTHAKLRRYERAPGTIWRSVGETIPVVLGRSGYGWGDGLHGAGPPAGRAGPLKREGDGRSPAGLFELGAAYGYAADAGLSIGYEPASSAHVCVDDPAAARYNQIFVAGAGERDFRSAERMRRDDGLYELAIVIEHNVTPVVPGHGSCIFLHVWAGPDTPVAGCTAMALPALQALARWLKPNAGLVVALPHSEYTALRRVWELP